MVAHKKRRYKLNCQEGYYTPMASQRSLHQPSAFRAPFLDASRMTPEVRALVTAPGEAGMKTTREWEECILQANVAWHAFQEEEARGVHGIHEGSDKDGSSTSGIYLPDEPNTFVFMEPQVFGDVKFKTELPKREEKAIDYCTDEDKEEDICKELDKLRMVIKQLNSKLHLLVVLVKTDQVGMLNHLWASILRLGQAYDALHARTRGVEQDLGDSLDVLDEFNLSDLSKGVMRALTQAIPQAGSNPQFSDLEDKVRELATLIVTVDEDHQKAGHYLLGKLCGNPPLPQIHLGGGMLSLGTPIVDDTGIQVRNLGQLLQGFENLTCKNTLLRERVDL